jgi:hypothetical protein
MINLHNVKFHMSRCSGSLVIAVEPKTKCRFRHASTLFNMLKIHILTKVAQLQEILTHTRLQDRISVAVKFSSSFTSPHGRYVESLMV